MTERLKMNRRNEEVEESEGQALETASPGIGLVLLRYFSTDTQIDLKTYRVKYSNDGLEILSNDGSHGYTLLGELQVCRDVEKRLNNTRRRYETMGRKIDRYFFDLREQVKMGGLMWRK